MKNTSFLSLTALRLLRGGAKGESIAKVLAPYAPVGWCAAAVSPGRPPSFVFSGEAVVGVHAVRRDTIFRVASISKVLGAAAALRLVKRGKLSLDGEASEVLGFGTGRPVTLRQLITHTASISDSAYDRVLGMPDAPLLDTLLSRSMLPFAPGTHFHYSNLGAGVVGMMVEAASGMLFDDFIRQEFFAPLQIDASFHPQRIIKKERMADCYRVPGKKLSYNTQEIAGTPLDEAPNPRLHYHIPAGKLMISAPDLLTIIHALPETDAGLFVRQKHIGSVKTDAARGLGVAFAPTGIFSPHRELWGHQGVAYGALCEAWIDITDGATAVLLTQWDCPWKAHRAVIQGRAGWYCRVA